MSYIVVGYESANSYIKSYCSIEGSKPDRYLNTLTEVDEPIDFFTKERHADVFEIEARDKNTGKTETLFFRAGLPFESRKQKTSSNLGIERYKTKQWRNESLIAIFKMIDGHDLNNPQLHIVTGVPSSHVTESATIDIENALMGTWKINNKTFTITKVSVVPQGLASVYHLMLNDKAEVLPKFYQEYKDKNFCLIDIGHGSLDFVPVDRLVPGSQREDEGMGAVWEKLRKRAEMKNDRFKSMNSKVLGIEKYFQESGRFVYNNIEIELQDDWERELKRYSDGILEYLDQNLEDTKYHKLFITGGGSILLGNDKYKFLRRAMNEKYSEESLKDRLIFVENPQFSNVHGYVKYGLANNN